jgi:hypothetical protein
MSYDAALIFPMCWIANIWRAALTSMKRRNDADMRDPMPVQIAPADRPVSISSS